MRILYLVGAPGIPAHGPSGASVHVRGITAGLASLGHDVELLAVRDRDGRGSWDPPTVPLHVAGNPGWPVWMPQHEIRRERRAARALARLAMERVRRGPPVDLVVERHSLFSDAARRLGRRTGIPWILEVNAPPVRERRRCDEPVGPTQGRAWERTVLRDAPGVAVVSTWLRHWAVEEMGCREERVFVLPNGCEDVQGRRPATRRRLGLPPRRPVLGFLGSFRRWHGLELLPALLSRLPRTRLLLVGTPRSGDAERILHRFPPGLRERVILQGRVRQQEVPHLVSAMDVGLAPYPADAPPWFCPLKILDYRAQGTPVVASDLGDCRGLVGEGGTVAPAGDADAFADAIRAWQGRRAPVWVRSWREVAAELLDAARRLGLVPSPPVPPPSPSNQGSGIR